MSEQRLMAFLRLYIALLVGCLLGFALAVGIGTAPDVSEPPSPRPAPEARVDTLLVPVPEPPVRVRPPAGVCWPGEEGGDVCTYWIDR